MQTLSGELGRRINLWRCVGVCVCIFSHCRRRQTGVLVESISSGLYVSIRQSGLYMCVYCKKLLSKIIFPSMPKKDTFFTKLLNCHVECVC